MIKFIPNIMTLTHLAFGTIAIVKAFEGEIGQATLLVLLAMLLDGFDGRVARYLNVKGDFGKELDSLADVVSFGVAPAMILYNVLFVNYDTFGLLVCVLIPICGVLRLARFNTSGYKLTKHFVGLPITAAGGVLSVLGTFSQHLNPNLIIVLSLLFSYLMISSIKFPNFKKIKLPKHIFIVVPIMVCFMYLFFHFFKDYMYILIIISLILFLSFVLFKIKLNITKKEDSFNEEEDEEKK